MAFSQRNKHSFAFRPNRYFSEFTDILILRYYSADPDEPFVPLITNANGKDNRDVDIVLGEKTEMYRSCSITWRGEYYIFGGDAHQKQVSKINGCEIQSIGKIEEFSN